ncbi:glycosyltransferase [Paeniroseomonas aquatica]|uniref:Glycosyltransferase n=1 Tax=Paeniroseomonas aquatica TaxID=373043 RepID=A0ABT8A3M8_9PROT|nr:glycosyltransferase [Paeniroseomonas aquatica]MDN3564387.1 glycosyltransferase [Paeniroseomonas aquatica]
MAACQAMQRLELGGRVIGIVPPDEYSPPPDVAELITFRYSAFSRLMSGDLDALAGAAGPGEVGCLILGADILRQIDATSLEMLRSRLSADAVVLAMGGADGTGAASCQSMLDRGVSFSFMHGDGLQVRAGTGGPGAMLPQLLDQAGNDPALGFAISQAFLRLGQGLRSRQRASDAHAAVERLELDLSQARGELDVALEALRACERDRQAGVSELQHVQTRQVAAEASLKVAQSTLSTTEAALRHAQDTLRATEQSLRTTEERLNAVESRQHDADALRATEVEASEALHGQAISLRGERDNLLRELEAIRASTSWRLTAPLRRMVGGNPSAARWARRGIKLAWWTVTLQLPARYRARRGQVAAAPVPSPGPVPGPAPVETYSPPAPIEPQPVAVAAPAISEAVEARIGHLEHRVLVAESLAKAEQARLDWSLGAVEGFAAVIDDYHAMRRTKAYQAAFDVADPLVSVCVATVNRAEMLVERALASLQAQTHRNLQIVVVGDHCTDDTARRIADLGDDRIVFANLPERGPYPPPGIDRWRVAGSNAMNHALSLCKGDFVTHLDDDDRMTADKIATMVAAARDNSADFLWHSFWYEHRDGSWEALGNGKLELGQVTTGSIFYHGYFARFGWDVHAYRLGEPGDWNRLRKIKMLRPRLHYVAQSLLFHHVEQAQPIFTSQDGERFLD